MEFASQADAVDLGVVEPGADAAGDATDDEIQTVEIERRVDQAGRADGAGGRMIRVQRPIHGLNPVIAGNTATNADFETSFPTVRVGLLRAQQFPLDVVGIEREFDTVRTIARHDQPADRAVPGVAGLAAIAAALAV